MSNKEYFNTLLVLGVIKPGEYKQDRLDHLIESDFEVENIHKRLYKEFEFSYILELLCKWADRFKTIDKFDMRIVDKFIDALWFEKNVMNKTSNATLKKIMLKEEFVENLVESILRYISIFGITEQKKIVNLNGRRLEIHTCAPFPYMRVEGDRWMKDICFIIYKDKKFKFIDELRIIEPEEYDMIIAIPENRRYIH